MVFLYEVTINFFKTSMLIVRFNSLIYALPTKLRIVRFMFNSCKYGQELNILSFSLQVFLRLSNKPAFHMTGYYSHTYYDRKRKMIWLFKFVSICNLLI